MSKSKYYYYVGIISFKGMIFVTSVNNSTKQAEWDVKEKPLALTREQADNIAEGLIYNFIPGVVVKSLVPIESQCVNKK